jgi:hypothetical protein
MTNVHGIKVAGATFPAQLWHDYMAVAKGGFCGKFSKPEEPAKLRPFCGRLSATKKCEPPPVEGDPSTPTVPADPVEATGGAPQEAGEPPPVPVPDTAIVRGPPSRTAARSAVFSFKAQGARATSYECSLDAGDFSPCESPASFGRLGPGDHVLSVRALSAAGDPDETPASYRWTVFEDLVPRSEQQQAPAEPTPAPKPKPKPKPKPEPEDPFESAG